MKTGFSPVNFWYILWENICQKYTGILIKLFTLHVTSDRFNRLFIWMQLQVFKDTHYLLVDVP